VLFNLILGCGMSSRLYQRIREKENLVYSVASYHNRHLHGGYQAVYAACAPRNLIEQLLRLARAKPQSTRMECRRSRSRELPAEPKPRGATIMGIR
jgi:hypothetical protein